jgi:hypothetical protein
MSSEEEANFSGKKDVSEMSTYYDGFAQSIARQRLW